jgi:hypothetical protein
MFSEKKNMIHRSAVALPIEIIVQGVLPKLDMFGSFATQI